MLCCILAPVRVALPVYDMIKKKEINGDNGTDVAAGLMAFHPGGWVIAPLLYLCKKFDDWAISKSRIEYIDSPVKNKSESNSIIY